MFTSQQKAKFTYASLILLLTVFVLANIVNNIFFKNFRLDFSEQKLYTLSQGSKEILTEIKEPIHIKLYFSKKLAVSYPYLISYAARVQELLDQYKRVSNNKLIVTIIDTEPFTEIEDEAVNYGLQGVPTNGNGSELYFGLVASNSVNNKEIIPFLQPNREAYLEYDISQMLYRLVYPTPVKIGIVTDLSLQDSTQMALLAEDTTSTSSSAIFEQIGQTFNIQKIQDTVSSIPADIKVLMLARRTDIPSPMAAAIEQFVMQGGHVLAFVDPQQNMPVTEQKSANNLEKLLQSWGVSIPSKVFVSPKLGKKIRYYQANKEYISNYPVWVDFSKEYFDKDDILTNNLEKMTFADSGVIVKQANALTSVTPLISSDGDNMLLDLALLPNYKDDPSKLLQDYRTDEQTHILAARITGEIQPVFTANTLNVGTDTSTKAKFTTNIILFANTKMLANNFWVNVQNFMGNKLYMPVSGNGGFVLNALDNLTGSNALISIRNKGVFGRPFNKVQNLQARSKIKFKTAQDSLIKNLELTKQKIVALESKKKDSTTISISTEQKQEEERFRNQLVEIRKELRSVQHELNKDIEAVELTIKFANIVLMPLLVLLAAGGVWIFRMKTGRQKYTNLLYSVVNVE